MATKLSEDSIKAELENLSEWSEVSGAIQKTFEFGTFLEAITFVSKVADYAEHEQHHPDILIRYNRVTITVSTHDAGGITEKDFALARATNELAAS